MPLTLVALGPRTAARTQFPATRVWPTPRSIPSAAGSVVPVPPVVPTSQARMRQLRHHNSPDTDGLSGMGVLGSPCAHLRRRSPPEPRPPGAPTPGSWLPSCPQSTSRRAATPGPRRPGGRTGGKAQAKRRQAAGGAGEQVQPRIDVGWIRFHGFILVDY
jgi:hypothetical protein